MKAREIKNAMFYSRATVRPGATERWQAKSSGDRLTKGLKRNKIRCIKTKHSVAQWP